MPSLCHLALAFGSLVAVVFVVAVVNGKRSVASGVIAGAFTGLVETTLMYPLENVKTQQQLHRMPLRVALQRTLTIRGWSGLYAGVVPVLLGAVPSHALRWGLFTLVCSWGGGVGCRGVWDTFLAALLAGSIVTILIGVPMETIKTETIHRITRNDSKHSHSKKPFLEDEIRVSIEPVTLSDCEEGRSHVMWRGNEEDMAELSAASSPIRIPHNSVASFKGVFPTLLKKIVNQAIRFPAHRAALTLLCSVFLTTVRDAGGAVGHHACLAADNVLLSLFAGAAAGIMSVVITQPIDVIKTRMQSLHAGRYKHSHHCLTQTVRHEGFTALFDGVFARALRSAFGAALTFAIFPVVHQLLNSDRRKT